LLGISVPEVIQGAEPEELLSEENFLGDFEREYLHLRLNEALPGLQSARSPTRKRGQPVNESTNLQRAVRLRTSTRSPSLQRFNSPPRGQPRTPAGRGAFQSPLQIGARGRHSPGEGRVCAERLSLPPRRRLSNDQQGRARSLQIQEQVSQTLCSLPHFPSGGLRRVRANRSEESGQPPRTVIWGEERFKVVQALHEGEGHYGGAEKTRLEVADRYWFPQLTNFVGEFVKTCDVCQKERVGAAARDDREIFPTPPTAPWFRTHVDLCGPFKESGPQKFRYIAVAVDSVTKFVEARPLRRSKLKGVDSEEVAHFLQTRGLAPVSGRL
jgi:hypothetical protein